MGVRSPLFHRSPSPLLRMLSTPNIKRRGGRCSQRNQPINLPEKIEKVRFTTFIAFDLHWYLEFDDILRHRCHATCHAQRKSLHFSHYITTFADYTGCSVSGSIGNDIDKHNVVSFVTLLWYYITMCAYTAVAWNLNQLMKPLAALFLRAHSTCFWLRHQIRIAIMIMIFTINIDHVRGNL